MELYNLLSFLSSPLFATFLLIILPFFYLLFPSKPENKHYNLPPSPPKLPLIGNLHQLGKLPHRSLWKLSQKYGPVMLLHLGRIPTLVVSTPQTAKQVLKTHDNECCSRPYSHGISKLTYNLLDVAFCPHSQYWKDIRKFCVVELFSVKRVQSFSHVREREVARLVNSINSDISPRRNPIEVNKKIFSLTNSMICSIAFGKTYDEVKQFEGFGKFEEAINEAMVMLSSFWADDFFPGFGWVIDVATGLHRRLEKCFSDFDTFYNKVIDEHLDRNRERPEHDDILGVLVRLWKDETAPVRLSRNHIKAILMDIFLGGIDTSSLMVLWAMTELIKKPTVMKKAQAEIRSIVGAKPNVSEEEIKNLKYFKMVVKETFRLHPPSALLVPRESMHDCKINGHDVPAKTRIYINAWAIGRDPNTWENPNEFCPERFEKNEVDFKGQHFELIPFGSGRRICPGINMGTSNVEFTLANLLHSFDWELPDGVKAEDISMEEEAGATVRKKDPLWLVPVRYEPSG